MWQRRLVLTLTVRRLVVAGLVRERGGRLDRGGLVARSGLLASLLASSGLLARSGLVARGDLVASSGLTAGVAEDGLVAGRRLAFRSGRTKSG